ncbi:MAG: hypothetical protein SCK28_03960, partial [Bacillota bacterium]|nr:hypothetical protein [Bacillota bacterium]
VIDPKYPGVVEEIINLGEFWNSEKLQEAKDEIINLCNKKAACYYQAYKSLEGAYEDMQKDSAPGLSDSEIKELVNKLGDQFFVVPKPRLRQLFAGAITPNGPVHYTKEIISVAKKKLKVVGGTRKDKSRILQQLSLVALEKGYNADLYHCFFDPDYYSMLLIPGLKLVLIDNYLPYVGQLLSDDEFTGEITIGERDSKVLFGDKATKHLDKAVEQIKLAKANHEELEKYYVQAMNYEAVDKLRQDLVSKILSYANKS